MPLVQGVAKLLPTCEDAELDQKVSWTETDREIAKIAGIAKDCQDYSGYHGFNPGNLLAMLAILAIGSCMMLRL